MAEDMKILIAYDGSECASAVDGSTSVAARARCSVEVVR